MERVVFLRIELSATALSEQQHQPDEPNTSKVRCTEMPGFPKAVLNEPEEEGRVERHGL